MRSKNEENISMVLSLNSDFLFYLNQAMENTLASNQIICLINLKGIS